MPSAIARSDKAIREKLIYLVLITKFLCVREFWIVRFVLFRGDAAKAIADTFPWCAEALVVRSLLNAVMLTEIEFPANLRWRISPELVYVAVASFV